MDKGYWRGINADRITRRRALGAGALAGGAAFLAACGGSSNSSKSGGGKAQLVAEPIDTTQQARRGGKIVDRTHADPPTLDVFNANIAHNAVGPYAYSSLLQFKPGYL